MSSTSPSTHSPSPPALTVGPLRWGHPPHYRQPAGHGLLVVLPLIAGVITVGPGVVLFGWYALRVIAVALATALLLEGAVRSLRPHGQQRAASQALMIGLLVAASLPPTAAWPIVVTATAIAVIVGQVLQGGMTNSVWHPVALGRVTVQLLFHEALTPQRWPVLNRAHLGTGRLSDHIPLPELASWRTAVAPPDVDAWLMVRPVDLLRGHIPLAENMTTGEGLARFITDHLPPWSEVVLGVSGGAIGEACVVTILLAGLVLLAGGLMRWPGLAAGLIAAFAWATVLPITYQQGESAHVHWLPGLSTYEGLPVGLMYVAYQVVTGALPFVAVVLSTDPGTSPFTWRGHVVYGLLFGSTAMALRVVVGLPADAYWALLIANTAVPAINRLTRRRVLGT